MSLCFFQHPYPSEEQKKQLAQDTGLTILQVNNWYVQQIIRKLSQREGVLGRGVGSTLVLYRFLDCPGTGSTGICSVFGFLSEMLCIFEGLFVR